MTTEVLDRRTLNRTLLARQLLLERARRPAYEVVEHLVGLQAQEPFDPYIGLWSRVDGFAPAELADLLEHRRAVRATVGWRTTIHLVTDGDAPLMRALTQPLATRTFRRTQWGRNLEGVDLDAVAAAGRTVLASRPRTSAELARELAGRWPDRDPASLAMAVRWLLPTVQVPPRGLWGRTGPPRLAPLETWLGRALPSTPTADEIMLRYLAAFGPASVADMRSWSGLSGLREAVDRLGDGLRRYRDEAGRVLVDAADATLADADLSAPVRFLPQYDNVLLGHHDRSRIVPPELRDLLYSDFAAGGGWRGSFTLDGFLGGTWRVEQAADRATLVVRPARAVERGREVEIEPEGAELLSFVAGIGVERRVEFA